MNHCEIAIEIGFAVGSLTSCIQAAQQSARNTIQNSLEETQAREQARKLENAKADYVSTYEKIARSNYSKLSKKWTVKDRNETIDAINRCFSGTIEKKYFWPVYIPLIDKMSNKELSFEEAMIACKDLAALHPTCSPYLPFVFCNVDNPDSMWEAIQLLIEERS